METTWTSMFSMLSITITKGFSVAIRRKLFLESKGFDENFYSSNSEDEDLGYRLIEKGYVIPIDRRLNAIHDVDISLFDFIKRSLKMHFGEMKLYLRKKKK